MTAVQDILSRLAALGCQVELNNGGVAIVGAVDRLTEELKEVIRSAKTALIVELLRSKAWELRDFIDGDTLLADRLARVPEYQETTDQLAEAQGRLFDSWRSAGFVIMWSPLVEEFILAGDGNRPPGSEGFAVYAWAEVEVLKDATPERVNAAHKVKKAFNGTVQRAARP